MSLTGVRLPVAAQQLAYVNCAQTTQVCMLAALPAACVVAIEHAYVPPNLQGVIEP